MDHLHSKDCIYRNLKPESIYFDESYITMHDFSLAKYLKNGQRTYTMCGTPEYIAPEMLKNRS